MRCGLARNLRRDSWVQLIAQISQGFTSKHKGASTEQGHQGVGPCARLLPLASALHCDLACTPCATLHVGRTELCLLTFFGDGAATGDGRQDEERHHPRRRSSLSVLGVGASEAEARWRPATRPAVQLAARAASAPGRSRLRLMRATGARRPPPYMWRTGHPLERRHVSRRTGRCGPRPTRASASRASCHRPSNSHRTGWKARPSHILLTHTHVACSHQHANSHIRMYIANDSDRCGGGYQRLRILELRRAPAKAGPLERLLGEGM